MTLSQYLKKNPPNEDILKEPNLISVLELIYQTKAVINNNKQNLLINLPSLQYRLMLLTQTTAIYSSFVCIFHLVEILCRLGSLKERKGL